LMVLSHPRFRWLQSRRDSHHRFTRVSMTLRRRVFRLSKKDIAIGSVTYNQYGYSYPSLYLSSRPGLSRTMADGGGLKPAVATQPPRAVNVFAGVPFSAGGRGPYLPCNGATLQRSDKPAPPGQSALEACSDRPASAHPCLRVRGVAKCPPVGAHPGITGRDHRGRRRSAEAIVRSDEPTSRVRLATSNYCALIRDRRPVLMQFRP